MNMSDEIHTTIAPIYHKHTIKYFYRREYFKTIHINNYYIKTCHETILSFDNQ